MASVVTAWLSACAFCKKVFPVLWGTLRLAVFALSMTGIYLIGTWIADTAPSIAYGLGTAIPHEVRPGGLITFYLPIKKGRDCDGVVHRYLTGQCGKFVLWEGPSTLPAGFDGRVVYPVRVPEEAIPGTCEFRVYARYFCNPVDWVMRDQAFASDPIDFTVLPP